MNDYQEAQKWLEGFDWDAYYGLEADKHLATICEALQDMEKYKDLEEQGKLLKLPCTVGDVVYALWSVPTEQKYVIYPAEVKEIRLGRYGNRKTIKYRLEQIIYRGRILDFYSDDFENKFFLTQEDAETALSKLQR